MKKTIDTLVDDIYQLVDQGKGTKKPDQEALFALGSTVMDAVRRQLWMGTAESSLGCGCLTSASHALGLCGTTSTAMTKQKTSAHRPD